MGMLKGYIDDLKKTKTLIAQASPVPVEGHFIAPTAFEVGSIGELPGERFGPVLHVARFALGELDRVVDEINATGYGLTLGAHTRIDETVARVVELARSGNVYVNRNMVGAVVGVQPFGGEGLSGTGPKAGGPHYLRRFRKSASTSTGEQASASSAVTVEAAALKDNLPDPGLGGWSTRSDRIAVLRKHLRGKGAAAITAAAAVDFGPVDLPGPTGEANTLALAPRGRVLCLGPDGETLLAQAIQSLAAGNAVLAVVPGASAALQSLAGKGLPISAIDGRLEPDELRTLDVDVVAFSGEGDAARSIRQALAERKGAIVPVVTEVIYPAAYAHERSVCVDTTAAGGNASLLAGAG
jgi:RHH-type proline utilization regulon transcriptional repressor/proline dehydrogenase/delta 1-pyrroline-5-carboxylate dehydrogenase